MNQKDAPAVVVISSSASYARQGVRGNSIAPGLIRAELIRGLTQNEPVAKDSTALHPLLWVGEASEVISATDWLLNPEPGWVTGQVIGVDGGLG